MTGRLLSPGLYRYGDLSVADRIETAGMAVSEAAIDRFADLTGDRFAIHIDDAAAQALGFPGRVAHGLLVLSLIDGLKNQTPAQFAAVASLEWQWTFGKPVLAGDTIRATIVVRSKRLTRSGDRGILTLEVEVRNQSDEIVQTGRNQLMVLV